MPRFTYSYLRDQFKAVIDEGYVIIPCREYVRYKANGSHRKVMVNRVDIDFSVRKAGKLLEIFDELGIKATFFLRLHAPEYNPFSFENYRIVKSMILSGHEVGYHSEVVDEAAIWNEDAEDCLRRDIDVMERMFGISVVGVASHGGMTGLNNLDFWKDRRPGDFDLLYEAYDRQESFNLFQESFYVSDSEWTRWKCYDCGTLCKDDHRSLSEHAKSGHEVLYSLVHPDTYFYEHFYDNER